MAAHSAARKRLRKPTITIMLVVAVVALAVLGVVIAFPLFRWTQPDVDAPVHTAAPKPSLNLPPGVSQTFAMRMYLEQIQSEDNFQRLVDGELSSISAEAVEKTEDGARVRITAHFADGSSGPGYLRLVKAKSGWYYASVAGTNDSKEENFASAVSDGDESDVDQSDADAVAHSGVTAFDSGVINAILSQSQKNSALAEDLVAGKVTEIVFGEPQHGAGTVTIPAAVKYRQGSDRTGQAVLISKQIDGRQLYFMTTLRME